MKKDFAKTLKELRLKAGYTQKQVYEMLNIPQSTFSSWEIGKAEPSASMTLKLCEIYHVDDILAAFGYDGYNDDGSIQLNLKEQNTIEKYRDLDDHGREMVDFTLEKEWERSISLKKVISYNQPLLNAAHERTDIEVTDEMRQHDNDIMNDDSEWE
jgi:transcriptional regulator with XRE-family HTH domain